MSSQWYHLTALAVFSGLSLNLILQFGLGIRSTEPNKEKPVQYAFFQWIIQFFTVLLLWLLFTYILTPLTLGFLEYLVIFPLASLTAQGLEFILFRLNPALGEKPRLPGISAYDGLIIAAFLLTKRLASSFRGALVLSLGFSLGAFLAALILHHIYRRCAMEKIPPHLRGTPLMLISAGLLSLIFSSVAAILLRVLEAV
jgi:electron transport complex protein RnfA